MKSIKTFVKVMQAMGKRCIIYLIAIFFMSAGSAMFSVMSSMLMKNVVDAAQSGHSDKILGIIISNILGGFLSIVVFALASMIYNVEAKRAYGNLCKRIFHHVVRLPYTYYEQSNTGFFSRPSIYQLSRVFTPFYYTTFTPFFTSLFFLF